MHIHEFPRATTGAYSHPLYIPEAKPIKEEQMYLLALLTEAGTQDRGCQRSSILSLEAAETEANRFLRNNPKGEVIFYKATKSLTVSQDIKFDVKYK